MFCPNCGKQLSDGAKFCSGCGKDLSNAGSVSNLPATPEKEAAFPSAKAVATKKKKEKKTKEKKPAPEWISKSIEGCKSLWKKCLEWLKGSKPKWFKWAVAGVALALILILVFVWIVPSVKRKNYYWKPMDDQMNYYNSRSSDPLAASEYFATPYLKSSTINKSLKATADYLGSEANEMSLDSRYQEISQNVGDDWQIELTINSATKLTKDEVKSIQQKFRANFTTESLDNINKKLNDPNELQKFVDIANQTLKEAKYDKQVDLKSTKKFLKASKKYEKSVYNLHKANISEAYRATYTAVIKSSQNSVQYDSKKCLFARINGKWCLLDTSEYKPMDIGLPTFQQQDNGTGTEGSYSDPNKLMDNYVDAYQQNGFSKGDATILGGVSALGDLYDAYEDAAYPTYEDKVLHKLDQIKNPWLFF